LSGGSGGFFWHDDGGFAAWTGDLRSCVSRVAQNVLAASRAGEFEFTHKGFRLSDVEGHHFTFFTDCFNAR
jgi:hypothetical protein